MTRNRKAGFSLLEVVIGLGLLVLGLALIAGAFPLGLRFYALTSDDTRASNLAVSTLTALRIDRVFGAAYTDDRWGMEAYFNALPAPPPEAPTGNNTTYLYRVVRSQSKQTPMAVQECFLERPREAGVGPWSVEVAAGSGRRFDPLQVQYLFDHDGTAAPRTGAAYTNYPFLHRRPQLGDLTPPLPLDVDKSARMQWARANERIGAAVQTTYYESVFQQAITDVSVYWTTNGFTGDPLKPVGDPALSYAPTPTPIPTVTPVPAPPATSYTPTPVPAPPIRRGPTNFNMQAVQAKNMRLINSNLADRVGRNYSDTLTSATLQDTPNTNNILMWLPWSDRIDTTDVIAGPGELGNGNAIAAGRYLSQVFYQQLPNTYPARYRVLVAVQRSDERPFQLFHKRAQAQPAWAQAANVDWRLAGWAVTRQNGGGDRWSLQGIDDTYATNAATDSNTEALNVVDNVFGRIRLHEVAVTNDWVTSTKGVTDDVVPFEPKFDVQIGGYLIDQATGSAYRLVERDPADPTRVRVDPPPDVVAGTRTMWAVPSCVGVYTALIGKQF